MVKEQFKKLMTALEIRVLHCETQLGGIRSADDLKKLTIEQAATLKIFCQAEESVMTKIAMVDLYHIIGMGNLSSVQMMQFISCMKKYLSFRPTVKVISQHLDKITTLPTIPTATKFKLLGLGNITLLAGENSSDAELYIEDYTQLDCPPFPQEAELPYTITDQVIRVNMTRLEEFAGIAASVLKTPITLKALQQRLNSKREYLGIDWQKVDAVEAIGVFKAKDIQKHFYSYSKMRQVS